MSLKIHYIFKHVFLIIILTKMMTVNLLKRSTGINETEVNLRGKVQYRTRTHIQQARRYTCFLLLTKVMETQYQKSAQTNGLTILLWWLSLTNGIFLMIKHAPYHTTTRSRLMLLVVIVLTVTDEHYQMCFSPLKW